MARFEIGTRLVCLRLPRSEGVKTAHELGLDGIEPSVKMDDIEGAAPQGETLADARRECDRLGLTISAIGGGSALPGVAHGEFTAEQRAAARRLVDFVADLEIPVITSHIGVVPEDRDSARYAAMRDYWREAADRAADRDVVLAIETGPERSEVLRGFIEDVASPALGVNLDPANLAMIINEDAVHAAEVLGPHVRHTHAKDGAQLRPCDASLVYDPERREERAADVERHGPFYEERAFGQGAVRWPEYLDALAAAGFDGFLSIERERSDSPVESTREAAEFLRGLV